MVLLGPLRTVGWLRCSDPPVHRQSGAKGFARNISGSGDRFNKPLERHRSRTLATATQVFRVDLEQRTTQPIFTTTEDDPILGVEEMELYSFDFDYGAVVATKRFIHLLTREGKLVLKTPYEPSYPGYDAIQICILEPPGKFGVFIAPSLQAWREAKGELPIRVIWLAEGQGVVKSVDLPGLPEVVIKPPVGRRLLDSLMPPPLLAMARLAKDKILYGEVPRWLLLVSGAAAALVCLPIGWWLGRRYRFTPAARAGWAVFHLLFGVPGLLAFLSVQEWPVREACPNCKKLRVVGRASASIAVRASPRPKRPARRCLHRWEQRRKCRAQAEAADPSPLIPRHSRQPLPRASPSSTVIADKRVLGGGCR